MRGQLPLTAQLLASWKDGRLKLYVTYRALRARLSLQALFQDGEYLPLSIKGERQKHVCAFARRRGDAWTLTIVPRLSVNLVSPNSPPVGQQVWADDLLQLPAGAPGHWHNFFTGEDLSVIGQTGRLAVGEILNSFPVALLIRIN